MRKHIFYNTVNFQPGTFRILFFRGIQTLQMRLFRKACFWWTQLLRSFCRAADVSLNKHIVILFVSYLLTIHDHITHALRFHSLDMNAMSREIQFQPFLHSHSVCPWIHTMSFYVSRLLIIHDHITHALRFHSSDMNATSREIQFQPFLHSHSPCPWIYSM